MSFLELGLSEKIVRAVTEHGYTQPTPIQTRAIPAVLAGGDLLAGAQTGTGKTAGFVLPILQLLSASGAGRARAPRSARTLILTPTRELTAQVEESVKVYGKYAGLSSLCIYGGVGINPQISALRKGVDILVATPGRLLDLIGQNALDLSRTEILVLDEADRMLDMGFIKDIRRILSLLPEKRQNLLFSATFSDEIKELAESFLHEPELIEVARRNSTVELIAQKVHPVDRDRKRELLEHLVSTQDWRQVLVFCRTKHGANRLAEQLDKSGITALAIHGNKSQPARMKALAQFKSGQLRVLVATDIAARGIDIDQLPHVVNYDLSNVPEDYVHRIGRTGRAGTPGEAISLVCVDEKQFLIDIERLIKREIPREVVAGFEPDPTARPQPIQLRSQGHPGPRQGGQRRSEPRAPAPPAGKGQGQGRNGNAKRPGGQRPVETQRPGGQRPVETQRPALSAQPPKEEVRAVEFDDEGIELQPRGVRHDAPRADDLTRGHKQWTGSGPMLTYPSSGAPRGGKGGRSGAGQQQRGGNASGGQLGNQRNQTQNAGAGARTQRADGQPAGRGRSGPQGGRGRTTSGGGTPTQRFGGRGR